MSETVELLKELVAIGSVNPMGRDLTGPEIGKLYGRGSCDTKGGMAAMLVALFCVGLAFPLRSAGAREHLSYEPCLEQRVWRVEQTPNLAAASRGARAGWLWPTDAGYGTQGLLPEVIDGRSDTYSLTSRWRTKPPYQLVIELPKPATVSALVYYTRFPEIHGDWSFAPRRYKVRTSLDGRRWQTVAEHRGKRAYSNIHTFAPVRAKYVAICDIVPSPHPKGTCFHEVAVHDLTHAAPATTIGNPGWWNQGFRFRTRLEQSGIATSGPVVRRSADLTTLLSRRIGLREKMPVAPVDLDSIRIVRCVRQGDRLVQEPCPAVFIPDARFDHHRFAVGTVAWWAGESKGDASWWLYANVQTAKTPKAKQPDTAFTVHVDGSACRATVEPSRAVAACRVLDDQGRGVASVKRGAITLNDMDPLRRYIAVGVRDGQPVVGRWFGLPQLAGAIGVTVDLPVWNYHRGQGVPVTIHLTNSADKPRSVTVEMRLVDVRGRYAPMRRRVTVPARGKLAVTAQVPTDKVACGDYELTLAVRDDNTVHYVGAADVHVAPARHPALGFGFYGWPQRNRLQAIQLTRDVARHNVTVSTGGGRESAIDEACAWGIDYYPRGPNEGLYPRGKTRVTTWDGTPRTGWVHKTRCPRDPDGLNVMADMVTDRATYLKRYASFRGFSCFDDYGFDLLRKGKTWVWTCYCPHCRRAYRDRYGQDAPQLDGTKWTSPVVPDDDPALRFIVERCKAVEAYVANYEAARAAVDPRLEIGMMMMRNVGVGYGQWPPYHVTPASVFSMYDYPSCAGTVLGYWTLYELGMMGNRNKKAWMLCEISDISRNILRREKALVPPWLVRNQFWTLVAAGFRTISYFHYGSRELMAGKPSYAEVTRMGAVAKRIGPLLAAVHPKPAAAAVFASLPDFCQPDKPGVWSTGKKHIDAIHRRLVVAHVPTEIVSDDEAVAGGLQRYKVVVMPNIDYIRRSALDALTAYAKKGGTVLVDERCRIDIPGSRRYDEEGLVRETAICTTHTLSANTANRMVVFREFDVPSGALFVLVNAQAELSGQLAKFRWGRLPLVQVEAVKGRLTLARPGLACYDLVAGRRLKPDADGAVPFHLAPGGGTVLVGYEQPIDGVSLSLDKRQVKVGRPVVATMTVRCAGKASAGMHLLDVAVFAPDGTPSDDYSRVRLARRGTLQLTLLMAVNDAPGEWTVKVTELASRHTATARFRLVP